jgi:imidazolonepropionase-like amidohydrolase
LGRIIAVEQNPLQDVRVLQHVNFVMKSGVVYKNETCKQEAACQ